MKKTFIRRGLLLFAALLMTMVTLAQEPKHLRAKVAMFDDKMVFYGGNENERDWNAYDYYVRCPDNDADNGQFPARWEEFKFTIKTVVFDESCRDIDVPITSTAHLFDSFTQLTSITGLENLPTDQVTTMKAMFKSCYNLEELDLTYLRTDNVADFDQMFLGCESLRSLDISSFSTENATSMASMFGGCGRLTSLDLSSFNTKNVNDMSNMFSGCRALRSLDVSHFNTANVTNMSSLFEDCLFLSTLNLNGFNTGKVTDMSGMFKGCQSLSKLDLSNFSTEKVTDMSSMFCDMRLLTCLDISHFSTAALTDMSRMFRECRALAKVSLFSIGDGDMNSVKGGGMFSYCPELRRIYVYEDWTPSRICGEYADNGSADPMFAECSKLVGGEGSMLSEAFGNSANARIDHGAEHPGLFTDKRGMDSDPLPQEMAAYGRLSDDFECLTLFADVDPLHNDDIKGYLIAIDEERGVDLVINRNTLNPLPVSRVVIDESFAQMDNITSLYYMFGDFGYLKEIQGLEYLKTDKVTNMSFMFRDCGHLEELDLSSFTTDNVTTLAGMFNGCFELQRIIVEESWNLEKIEIPEEPYWDDVFFGCYQLVGGMGTKYSEYRLGTLYARIDGGHDQPGYFSTREQLENYNPVLGVETALTDRQEQAPATYSLDGRKHVGSNLKPGVYVREGRKVVVR